MIDRTSTKFESVVGFSNGIEELTLKKPPPLVPSCLIAIWEATGPSARVWLAPSSVRRGHRAGQGLQGSLGDEDQGDDDRQRQEHVVEAADQVLPEVAEPLAACGR